MVCYVIFDLDDTLVRYGNKKRCVPRQTFHCLRDLYLRGFILFVVTYNPLGVLIAHEEGLFKYIKFLLSTKNTNDQSKIIEKLFSYFPTKDFIYFDDRQDNIQQVQLKYPYAICIHVPNPLLLFTQIKF